MAVSECEHIVPIGQEQIVHFTFRPVMASSKGLIRAVGAMAGDQHKKNVKTGDMVIIGVLIVMGLLAAYSDKDPAEPVVSAAEEVCRSTLDAKVAARGFIEDRLVSPGTADFGVMESMGKRDTGRCVHALGGYVDSQSVYGAMIRTNFKIIVEYDKTTDRWIQQAITLE